MITADTLKNYEPIANTTQTVSVTVEKVTPAVSVNAEVSDGTGARQAVLTAAIGKVGEGVLPTGTVTFVDVTNTDTEIGNANVENGVARFTWTGLAQQEYKVKAVYSGDTNYRTANGEITFDTSKEPQAALSIADIGTKTYGDSPFSLSATGGSGTGAVTFESSDSTVLSISGSTATIHKAGEVTITATKAADSWYNEEAASVTVIVAKKLLTVTAEDKTVIAGTQMPDLTYTVKGLVNGDRFTAPKMETTAKDTNTPGIFEITVSGGTLTNESYDVTYLKGILDIREKEEPTAPKKGTIFTKGKLEYKITNASADGTGTVKVLGFAKGETTRKLNIPDTVKKYGIVYRVTKIGKGAFRGEAKLQTVKIGDRVTKIGIFAFFDAKNVRSVTVGKRVEWIKRHAFCRMKNLRILTVNSKKLVRVDGYQFHRITRKVRMKLPKGKVKAHKKFFRQ